MQTAAVPQRVRLDELVLDHLTNQRTLDFEDAALTNRFVRPYEKIELQDKPRTYAKTVKRDPHNAWYDKPEVALIALENPEELFPPMRSQSWLWLGISLLAGAAAVGFLALL